MQTFLPDPCFATCARMLDDRRLGKQRVETFQILRALVWPKYGWKHHPAVAMWRGFVPALVCYGLAVCAEWAARGHSDAVAPKLAEFTGGRAPHRAELYARGLLPPWLGDEALHLSHRSVLVAKDGAHYRSVFAEAPPEDLPYVWPLPCFPRWPVRSGEAAPLELVPALHLLGREEVTEEEISVLAAVTGGVDHEFSAPAGTAPARDMGLLAGLCTPGTTLWIGGAPLPADEVSGPPPRRRPPVRATGDPAPGAAREPDEASRRAMRQEAAAIPQFHFPRPGQPLDGPFGEPGLLVVDHIDPEPYLGRLPGVPVLWLHDG